MERVRLKVNGIANIGDTLASMIVVLAVVDKNVQIPIVVDTLEADSIGRKISADDTQNRMSVHELFRNALCKFDISVEEVLIYKFEEGIFYSRIFLSNADKSEFVEAHTADAISIALQFGCPIYTNIDVIKKAGVTAQDNDNFLGADEFCFNLKEANLDVLSQLLEKAIEDENYEFASSIRDEINSRNK